MYQKERGIDMSQNNDVQISNDKMRFVESGEGLEVDFPQCVNCKYNNGAFECEALSRKPEEYMSNEEECPMLEQE